MKTYEDLSRRALIKLNHDYDRDNDEALLHYLEQMDQTEHYEGVRVVESVTAKVDNVVATVKGNGNFMKKAAVCAVDNVLEKVAKVAEKIAMS